MVFRYMECILGFKLVMYYFESKLHLWQHIAFMLPTLPRTLEGVKSQEEYLQYRDYCIDKSNYRFLHTLVSVVMNSLMLYFAMMPWFWKISGELLGLIGLDMEYEILHTLLFLATSTILPQAIHLSFNMYSTFMIDVPYGLSQVTIGSYFKNTIKYIARSVATKSVYVGAIIIIVQNGGPYVAIYLWVGMLVYSLGEKTIYPTLMAPLFKQFKPLPEGELRTKIETLATSLKFPLKKLFVVHGSSLSEPYVCGFFNNKWVCLSDTLTKKCKEEEILALIARQLCHWQHYHWQYNFIATQICLLFEAGLYTLVRNSEEVFESFGFDTQPAYIGYIIFQIAAIPLQCFNKLARSLIKRTTEFQADDFAKRLGLSRPLRDAIIKLEGNFLPMHQDPWFSAYIFSCPNIVERLAAIDEPDRND